MHCVHGDHVDEHKLDVNSKNPAQCSGRDTPAAVTMAVTSTAAAADMKLSPTAIIPTTLLQAICTNVHEGHCDNHGPIDLAV